MIGFGVKCSELRRKDDMSMSTKWNAADRAMLSTVRFVGNFERRCDSNCDSLCDRNSDSNSDSLCDRNPNCNSDSFCDCNCGSNCDRNL